MIPRIREPGYDSLALAIIEETVEEYERARRQYLRKPNNLEAQFFMREAFDFFHSSWCGVLIGTLDHDKFCQRLYRRFPEMRLMKTQPIDWNKVYVFLKNNRRMLHI